MTPQEWLLKFPDEIEPNRNCALDYACPRCGNRGPFRVHVSDYVTLDDQDGYSFPIELEETGAPPQCMDCGYKGHDIIVPGLDEYLEYLENNR